MWDKGTVLFVPLFCVEKKRNICNTNVSVIIKEVARSSLPLFLFNQIGYLFSTTKYINFYNSSHKMDVLCIIASYRKVIIILGGIMGKYIGLVGSFASICSLFFVENIFHLVMCVISMIFLVIAIIFEIREYRKNRPRRFDRHENIMYMKSIIENEGEVIICAGNLSWVDNNDIKKAIIDKGAELTLCAKKTAPNLAEFKKAGVKVLTYGDGIFCPTTHFTIIHPQKPNEKIMFTSVSDDYDKEQRKVYEISKSDASFQNRWITYAAADIYGLVKLLNDKYLSEGASKE